MEFDEDAYTIKVDGLVSRILELKIKDLRNGFEQVDIIAALQVSIHI